MSDFKFKPIDYKTTGVDINLGRSFVKEIKKRAPSIGGFGGMFKIPHGYEEPILVSGTDGVGTKLNIAEVAGKHRGIGIDLVAMCVNDVITSGAKPLYFLDYLACGKLTPEIHGQVIDGIIDGCKMSGMQLLGGETAEMSKIYGQYHKYDVAGFCTGIVEQNKIVDGKSIKPSDKIIGIESSGLHSNGYSLVNYLLTRHRIFYSDHPELLTPTTIYVPLVQKLLDEMDTVYGMAHITGGGIPENLPRCIPSDLKIAVDYNSWKRPEIFNVIQNAGEIEESEMRNTFNLGIGYCIVVPDNCVDDAMEIINSYNFSESCYVIGEIHG